MKADFSTLKIRKIYNAFSREGVDTEFSTDSLCLSKF